jgi:hypothetical protein
VVPELGEKERATRTRQLEWRAKQFSGRLPAQITSDAVSKGRGAGAAETLIRGKPRKHRKTGELIAPKEYRRSAATVSRHIGDAIASAWARRSRRCASATQPGA